MWHLAIHRWTAHPSEAIEDLAPHLEWIRAEQLSGRILFAGPSADGQLGIIVFGHMSAEEAESLSRRDPFVAHGHRTCELIGWDVHQALGIGFQTEPVEVMTKTDPVTHPECR